MYVGWELSGTDDAGRQRENCKKIKSTVAKDGLTVTLGTS
jgi:hypothetical protein